MKIYPLLFLFVAPAALNAFTVDDLESAIKCSDEHKVQTIVKEIQITANDKERILILANDMVEQRKVKYQSLFVNNFSFLKCFDYSALKIAALALCAGLIVSGIVMDKIAPKELLISHREFTITTPFQTIKGEANYYTALYPALGLLSAAAINVGVNIKFFYDTKKQYDRAINIKQLIYKCIAQD